MNITFEWDAYDTCSFESDDDSIYCSRVAKLERQVKELEEELDIRRKWEEKNQWRDPFCGSGSTGKAAILEGFNFVGIDKTAEYIPIARARIEWAQEQDDKES